MLPRPNRIEAINLARAHIHYRFHLPHLPTSWNTMKLLNLILINVILMMTTGTYATLEEYETVGIDWHGEGQDPLEAVIFAIMRCMNKVFLDNQHCPAKKAELKKYYFKHGNIDVVDDRFKFSECCANWKVRECLLELTKQKCEIEMYPEILDQKNIQDEVWPKLEDNCTSISEPNPFYCMGRPWYTKLQASWWVSAALLVIILILLPLGCFLSCKRRRQRRAMRQELRALYSQQQQQLASDRARSPATDDDLEAGADEKQNLTEAPADVVEASEARNEATVVFLPNPKVADVEMNLITEDNLSSPASLRSVITESEV